MNEPKSRFVDELVEVFEKYIDHVVYNGLLMALDHEDYEKVIDEFNNYEEGTLENFYSYDNTSKMLDYEFVTFDFNGIHFIVMHTNDSCKLQPGNRAIPIFVGATHQSFKHYPYSTKLFNESDDDLEVKLPPIHQ